MDKLFGKIAACLFGFFLCVWWVDVDFGFQEDELYESECESMGSLPADGWGLVATSPSQTTDFLMYGVSPGFKTASWQEQED